MGWALKCCCCCCCCCGCGVPEADMVWRRMWLGWAGGVVGARAAEEVGSSGVIYRGINGGWLGVVLTARN